MAGRNASVRLAQVCLLFGLELEEVVVGIDDLCLKLHSAIEAGLVERADLDSLTEQRLLCL